MAAACRMQEPKYFSDGAIVVFSVENLNWLSKRRFRDTQITKKRDEGVLHLWITSGQMIQSDEERQPLTFFCILYQRGRCVTLQSWRSTDCIGCSVTRSPSTLSPLHCSHLKGLIQHSASTDPCVTGLPEEAAGTKLILQDIFSLFTKYLNTDTQQKTIIFWDDCTPAQVLSDFTQDALIACHNRDNNNMSLDIKNLNAVCTSSSEDDQTETVFRDNLNTQNPKGLLKSCRNNSFPGGPSRGDANVKIRKSVSFDDDVMVFLFDQESPTVELHPEACTSLPRSLLGVTSEDCGLEWDDDFSALNEDCHFQFALGSRHNKFTLPAQSWSPLSRMKRCCLSQSCLFLTYVTEADLEL